MMLLLVFSVVAQSLLAYHSNIPMIYLIRCAMLGGRTVAPQYLRTAEALTAAVIAV
jgi:hypothetical protein